ncbi:MAG: DUF4303 domain-containing protein [Desulfobacterales bacterium]|nr:DUF4303 domain-containing protein [Desulfobacterales bacterium]MCP4162914.1 DUF4303 domain-containing protein [Deltaproteobacteria bacterium]
MDFEKLENVLYKKGLDAFATLFTSRPLDNFYSFGFYTTGEYNYAATTASSYEGLEQVLNEYGYGDKPKDSIEIKWSPVDSPLHSDSECCGIIKEVNELLNEALNESDRIYENEGLEGLEEFNAQIENAFLNALKRLDAKGVFGKDELRKKVVVNLLKGDQSYEERLEFAKKLNPPEAVEIFTKDMDLDTYNLKKK